MWVHPSGQAQSLKSVGEATRLRSAACSQVLQPREQEDAEHDEDGPDDDAPRELLQPAREQEREKQYEQGRRRGQRGYDAHLAETERDEDEQDGGVLGEAAADEIEQALAVAQQRAPVPRGEDEGRGRDHRRRDVDGRVEDWPGVA